MLSHQYFMNSQNPVLPPPHAIIKTSGVLIGFKQFGEG